MEKIAIIDLGTNTFNLIIVELTSATSYQKIFTTKISVKLGEGGINKGFIAPVPFQRGVDAIKVYKESIDKYSVNRTVAIATSAIRDASNGQEFVNTIKQLFDIDIKTVSGNEEADLIYLGVKDAVKMSNDTSLIIDIGGGSTECIIANDKEIFWKKSFLLGAARLLEKINPSDVITSEELTRLEEHLEQELRPLFEAVEKYPIIEIIGSSGSFDSFSKMIALRFYSIDAILNKTEYTYNLNDFKIIYEEVIKSTKEEREVMKGLSSMRVDMIVISCILLNYILKKLQVKKMRSSTYSLKEGVLHQLLIKE